MSFLIQGQSVSTLESSDYMLQLNFRRTHIAGSVNTAADFLSRLDIKVAEKIRLKISEDIQTTPSSDVTDVEQFFLTQADSNDETEQ